MKKSITILAVSLLTVSMFAQAPQKMSYQAVIRNTNNALVITAPVGMQISILQGSPTGTPVYVETQVPSTNANGLISLEIGSGTIVTGTFASINWAVGPYFIKTETDPAGGTAYSTTGTTQLMSVPYSLYAEKSGTTIGGFTHYVGELFEGGIIVSLWKISGVEHGLIASLVDISAGAAWSNITTTLVGATAQSPSNGQGNTTAIIAQTGHSSSAAQLCDIYTSGGFSDWYLPAIWELKSCFNAANIVNEVLGDVNGLTITWYWSSTESASDRAYLGDETTTYKSQTSPRVRAVRKF